jgi:hypothetical protein
MRENPMQQSQWQLSTEFKKELERHNFLYVGEYGVDGKTHTIKLNSAFDNWRFTIYTFVSYANGGKHIRIGKVEESGLKGRLRPYWLKESLRLATDIPWIEEHMSGWNFTPPDAMPEMLSQYGRFTTTPWEREAWVEYTVPYGGQGGIFARPPVLGIDRSALKAEEERLIRLYDPPCNNDRFLPSARCRRTEWIASHGREPIRIKKRNR